MARTVTKLLGFTLALMLALPPGWCCMIPALDTVKESETASERSDCCCGTTPCEPEKQPDAPREPYNCCCGYRDLTRPTSADNDLSKDLSVAVAVVLLQDIVSSMLPCGIQERTAPIASRPLHVLDCVWRC